MINVLGQLLGQFSQFPISPSKTRQKAEQPNPSQVNPTHLSDELDHPVNPLGMRLMVPAGVLLHGLDGVRCPGHHGPLLLRRLRQHRSLHLRDDAQVSAQHVWRLPGTHFVQ